MIIQTNIRLLSRQESKTNERHLVEETFRDLHGNTVRLSARIGSEARYRTYDYVRAENFAGGRWEPLTMMFYDNHPDTIADAMMWLLATVGAILDWPGLPLEAEEQET